MTRFANPQKPEHPAQNMPLWPTALIGVSMIVLLAQPFWIGWVSSQFSIDSDLDAARIEAIAALVQIGFTLLLVGMNIYLGIMNRQMTKATQVMADIARRQLLDSELPVVVLSVLPSERTPNEENDGFLQTNISVELVNGGGPALDVRAKFVRAPQIRTCTAKAIPQPFSLITGNRQVLRFSVSAIQLMLDQHEIPEQIGEAGEIFIVLGQICVSYRDIYDREVGSGATLAIEKREEYLHAQLRDTWFSRPKHVSDSRMEE